MDLNEPTSKPFKRSDAEAGQPSTTLRCPVDVRDIPRQSPFAWSAYLTQATDEHAPSLPGEVATKEIKSGVFQIGRSKDADLCLASSIASRKHARIHRRETTFYLEDCLSTHGTYVNGDRVLWCRLCNGDMLQFGITPQAASRWYFDRAAVRQTGPSVALESSTRSRPESVSRDQLIVTFWGCRGSIPTPGAHTEIYGGNTTCVEVRFNDALFILDAGTGIRALGSSLEREFGDSELNLTLFLSHLHWDHIQGFPFLGQAYEARNRLQIVGVDHQAGSVKEMLRHQMQGLYFPVPMEAMQAQISFLNPSDEIEVEGVQVSTFPLPHPGGAYAYKLSVNSGTFIFATDCELNALCPNIADIEPDAVEGRQFPTDLIEFFHRADLLIIDCQYTNEQYQQRIGWGHNSIATVIDFCRQAEVRTAALTHHDPSASDDDIRHMVEYADHVLKSTATSSKPPRIFAAREEMMVAVSRDW